MSKWIEPSNYIAYQRFENCHTHKKLIPILYYHDKTRVQMFYFLSISNLCDLFQGSDQVQKGPLCSIIL